MSLELEHRPSGWWIVGLPDTAPECGPYDTKVEAQSDKRGLERFYKNEDRRAFFTTDRKA